MHMHASDVTETLDRPPSRTRQLARRTGATTILGVLLAYMLSVILGAENVHTELAYALLGTGTALFGVAAAQNVRDAQAQVDIENVRLTNREEPQEEP